MLETFIVHLIGYHGCRFARVLLLIWKILNWCNFLDDGDFLLTTGAHRTFTHTQWNIILWPHKFSKDKSKHTGMIFTKSKRLSVLVLTFLYIPIDPIKSLNTSKFSLTVFLKRWLVHELGISRKWLNKTCNSWFGLLLSKEHFLLCLDYFIWMLWEIHF